VIASHYDSNNTSTAPQSILYLLGRPVSQNLSSFASTAPAGGKWWFCSDTGLKCKTDADCRHECNSACTISLRAGSSAQIRRCACSNNVTKACSADAECTAGATCAFSQAPPPPAEDDAACLSNIRYVGTNPARRVTACRLKAFFIPGGAVDVAHFSAMGRHYLVFAAGDGSGQAPLFMAIDGNPSGFTAIAPATCSGSMGLKPFFSPLAKNVFLLCSSQRAGNGVALLRWNGTNFLDLEDPLRLAPADAAGGQLLPYPATRAVEHVTLPVSTGASAPIELIIIGGGQSEKDLGPASESSLFRSLYENSDLSGPVALAISPGSGAQVYVANLIGGTISVFLRDPASGSLAHAPWLVTRMPSKGSLGRLSAIAVAPDGGNLYATDMSSGALHVFSRSTYTGALSYSAAVISPASARMEGPCAIVVAPPSDSARAQREGDGGDVYVAAMSGQGVVHFRRNSASDGSLEYADAFWNGERDLQTMKTAVPLPNNTTEKAEYPMRLLADRSWGSSVGAARQFDVAGRRLLAVAAGGGMNGAIVIMEWDPFQRQFITVQEIASQSDAIDLADFEVSALKGAISASAEASNETYLAAASASGFINVYQYNLKDGKFVFHHQLPAPEVPIDDNGCSCPCSAAATASSARETFCVMCLRDEDGSIQSKCGLILPVCRMASYRPVPGRIRFFQISGSVYLAVTGLDVAPGQVGGCGGRTYSVIYRWRDGRRLMLEPSAGKDTASRFEVFQVSLRD
jgi:hypothetical protein